MSTPSPLGFAIVGTGMIAGYHAQAIGGRSQSAKTYLERKFQTFPDASVDDLIRHALLALRDTLGG